jgi:hypothetical protein
MAKAVKTSISVDHRPIGRREHDPTRAERHGDHTWFNGSGSDTVRSLVTCAPNDRNPRSQAGE